MSFFLIKLNYIFYVGPIAPTGVPGPVNNKDIHLSRQILDDER